MKEAFTKTAHLWVEEGEEDILYMHVYEGAVVELEDVKNHYRVSDRLMNGKKALVLAEATTEYTISAEARAYAATRSHTRIATAVVTRKKTNKVLTNLYLKINKPVSPLKVFSSRDKALEWLRSFREK